MSHHFKETERREPPVEPVDEVVMEPAEEPVVEATASVEETPPQKVLGVVNKCVKLNVRAEPDSSADVRTTIPVMSEVEVDLEASTDTFYKVCTAAGIEGFCMREFILLSGETVEFPG